MLVYWICDRVGLRGEGGGGGGCCTCTCITLYSVGNDRKICICVLCKLE